MVECFRSCEYLDLSDSHKVFSAYRLSNLHILVLTTSIACLHRDRQAIRFNLYNVHDLRPAIHFETVSSP